LLRIIESPSYPSSENKRDPVIVFIINA